MTTPQPPFVRNPYNYDTWQASHETGIECKDDSLAQQSSKEECDINFIVKQFGLTGKLPEDIRLPEYVDYEDVFDYQSALNAVKAAEESFMELPAETRAKFDNHPGKFLEFCGNEANRAQLYKMGLLNDQAKAAYEASLAPPPAPGGPTPGEQAKPPVDGPKGQEGGKK